MKKEHDVAANGDLPTRPRMSTISNLAAAGIGFDGLPLPGAPQHYSEARPTGWFQRLFGIASKALSHLKGRAISAQEVLEDDDIEAMHAWSITARLAAVPGSYIEKVPPEVAKLIREAQGLHPQMADGAAERDARGEPCPQL